MNADTIIREPGKFEGEQTYVPHFYEVYLDGWHDYERGDNMIGFKVTKEDREKFPALKGKRSVWLRFREDGFIQEVQP
jgi:hypothetical protein